MDINDVVKIIRSENRSAKNENVEKDTIASGLLKGVVASLKEITEMRDKMMDLSNTDDVNYKDLIKSEVNFCFESLADVYFRLSLESSGERRELCQDAEKRLIEMKI